MKQGVTDKGDEAPKPSDDMTQLGDVAGAILDAKLSAGGAPILARRRGPERKLAEEKEEERKILGIAHVRRALLEKPHKMPSEKGKAKPDLALETMLRKTATKGVVALFNAVRSAQCSDDEDSEQGRAANRAKRKRETQGHQQEDASSPSKQSFLDILRRGGEASVAAAAATRKAQANRAAAETNSNGARFLRDDFMLGPNRNRDYEREVEGDELEQQYGEDAHGVESGDSDE